MWKKLLWLYDWLVAHTRLLCGILHIQLWSSNTNQTKDFFPSWTESMKRVNCLLSETLKVTLQSYKLRELFRVERFFLKDMFNFVNCFNRSVRSCQAVPEIRKWYTVKSRALENHAKRLLAYDSILFSSVELIVNNGSSFFLNLTTYSLLLSGLY